MRKNREEGQEGEEGEEGGQAKRKSAPGEAGVFQCSSGLESHTGKA
jgi:hypothetical protein